MKKQGNIINMGRVGTPSSPGHEKKPPLPVHHATKRSLDTVPKNRNINCFNIDVAQGDSELAYN